MPRPGGACQRHLLLFILWCYFASRVAGQCVMVDVADFTGSDLEANVIRPLTFDLCKETCLLSDTCTAAELKGIFCVNWDVDPQESASPGSTISKKECSPDPADPSSSSPNDEETSSVEQSISSLTTLTVAVEATSSSIDLQPSETSSSIQMTSSFSTASSTVTFCVHGVTEITEAVDYLELDGGISFADDIFAEQGWTSTTTGGDTFSIRFTGDGVKTLQQLSFVIKNGDGTEVIVEIETAPAQFDIQDFINVGSDEQSYVHNFNTPFVSVSITTTATISNLILKLCNENPGNGATSSTPVVSSSVGTQQVIEPTITPLTSSISEISTLTDFISQTETAVVSGDGATSSTSVVSSSVGTQQVIEPTITPLTSSTSEISTLTDIISPTETTPVSGDGATSSTPVVSSSLGTQQVIEPTVTPLTFSTSEISTSTDVISPTETATVSASSVPSACTMIEMTDTDASNSATEYTLEGAEDCRSVCQTIEECQHFIYIDDNSTCMFYNTSSITSFFQVNHTIFSKQSCPSGVRIGEPCCFDVNTNASSTDEAALTLTLTPEACREFCLRWDYCEASVFTGDTCKIMSTSAVTLPRENMVLFMKDCASNAQFPFTHTEVCSDGGGNNIPSNWMMAVVLAGPIITGHFESLL